MDVSFKATERRPRVAAPDLQLPVLPVLHKHRVHIFILFSHKRPICQRPGASNPFPLHSDSLWPPDGATRLQKHVTIRKVCALPLLLPLRLTLSIQGIATSPLPRLMTALSQNKLKAWVRNVHHSLPKTSEQHGLTVIFQELWTLGALFFFFFFRKHKQTNTKTPKQNS